MKYLSIIGTLIMVTLYSCKDKQTDASTAPRINDPVLEEVPNTNNEFCYLYAKDKDTISLNLTKEHQEVNGTLRYKFYQIDGSWGTFSGTMIGDTLRGIYDFEAEGTKSKRELIFLIDGNQLIQGNGKTELSGSTEKFTDNPQFTFDKGQILEKVTCKPTVL